MMNTINKWACMAYARFTGFVQSFKEDERGLSGVVVAILLILVAVVAVVAIWGFLDGWLSDLWLRITGSMDQIQEY